MTWPAGTAGCFSSPWPLTFFFLEIRDLQRIGDPVLFWRWRSRLHVVRLAFFFLLVRYSPFLSVLSNIKSQWCNRVTELSYSSIVATTQLRRPSCGRETPVFLSIDFDGARTILFTALCPRSSPDLSVRFTPAATTNQYLIACPIGSRSRRQDLSSL